MSDKKPLIELPEVRRRGSRRVRAWMKPIWEEHEVELALDMMERVATVADLSTQDERDLADALQDRMSWTSVHAGAVAHEAWTRYYSEPDSGSESDSSSKEDGE